MGKRDEPEKEAWHHLISRSESEGQEMGPPQPLTVGERKQETN